MVTHNTIPVTVKGKDGSIKKYSVLSRNILHKTKVTVANPKQLRSSLINSGLVKPANT